MLSLPGRHLGQDASCALDPPIEALAAQHANLDLDHAQPAGMLGDAVELSQQRRRASAGRKAW